MKKEERALFEKAISYWGAQAQIGMLHEEIGELIKAINKFLREKDPGASKSAYRANVLEEIEDVRVMLDQMVILFKSTDEYQEMIREEKTRRIIELINISENYKKRLANERKSKK